MVDSVLLSSSSMSFKAKHFTLADPKELVYFRDLEHQDLFADPPL
jgi:hypothetical protein